MRAKRLAMEVSGACGDLGTFIPHVIGAMTVADHQTPASHHHHGGAQSLPPFNPARNGRLRRGLTGALAGAAGIASGR